MVRIGQDLLLPLNPQEQIFFHIVLALIQFWCIFSLKIISI